MVGEFGQVPPQGVHSIFLEGAVVKSLSRRLDPDSFSTHRTKPWPILAPLSCVGGQWDLLMIVSDWPEFNPPFVSFRYKMEQIPGSDRQSCGELQTMYAGKLQLSSKVRGQHLSQSN